MLLPLLPLPCPALLAGAPTSACSRSWPARSPSSETSWALWGEERRSEPAAESAQPCHCRRRQGLPPFADPTDRTLRHPSLLLPPPPSAAPRALGPSPLCCPSRCTSSQRARACPAGSGGRTSRSRCSWGWRCWPQPSALSTPSSTTPRRTSFTARPDSHASTPPPCEWFWPPPFIHSSTADAACPSMRLPSAFRVRLSPLPPLLTLEIDLQAADHTTRRSLRQHDWQRSAAQARQARRARAASLCAGGRAAAVFAAAACVHGGVRPSARPGPSCVSRGWLKNASGERGGQRKQRASTGPTAALRCRRERPGAPTRPPPRL